jgi:hypothetical protein
MNYMILLWAWPGRSTLCHPRRKNAVTTLDLGMCLRMVTGMLETGFQYRLFEILQDRCSMSIAKESMGCSGVDSQSQHMSEYRARHAAPVYVCKCFRVWSLRPDGIQKPI